jgi:hypothetical protein
MFYGKRGSGIVEKFLNFELRTRPIHPESSKALTKRWSELPDHVKTANQMLGRAALGCEGTHGVFPRCNLTCSPCYHSADANKVAIDGEHTVKAVGEQMKFLRTVRGPRAHAQLIGGEVSLLPARDHALALLAMRSQGREPMSMTHGDFDYTYLLNVVLDDEGTSRFKKVSFAGHFDSLMRGRRGLVRPQSETDLNPFREKFAKMFLDLKRDYGVNSYIAHNMTVTPSNHGQVSQVTKDVFEMSFNMLSFQPAAYVGDDRRWKEDFNAVTIDSVWNEIEAGVGQTLPWQGIQFGDPRCNRSIVVLKVGAVLVPLLDPNDPADLLVRDCLLTHFGGMIFGGIPKRILGIKILRAAFSHPRDVFALVALSRRFARRAGGLSGLIHALHDRQLGFKTFVVHNFMDAEDVRPAWDLMEKGITSQVPRVKETQERLGACMYAMAHPETGRLIPACVQHSLLDPVENITLLELLPTARSIGSNLQCARIGAMPDTKLMPA